MNRYLVIGHRTLGGAHLFDHLEQLRGEDPSCQFHVVVPQYTPRDMLWEEGTTHDVAQRALDDMLAAMAAAGMTATGEVGNAHPVHALRDTIEREGADAFKGIILSTLPHGISHWLSLGDTRRIEKHFPSIPVTHLIAEQTVDH